MRQRQPIGTIPVRPHLENIALIAENKWEDRILDLRNGTLIAYQLASLLKHKMALRKRKDILLSDPMVGLKFRYTKTNINRGRISFSKEQILFYNNFLHLYMHDLLRVRIDYNKNTLGKSEADSIWEFMDDYKLHTLIEFDALKKSSYRVQKRKFFC